MMKKILAMLCLVAICGCSWYDFSMEEEERLPASPTISDEEYSRFAKDVTVVQQKPDFVIYEYKNIRVDELAVLAALYCYDQEHKRAYLDNITLYHNNNRRARFNCR